MMPDLTIPCRVTPAADMLRVEEFAPRQIRIAVRRRRAAREETFSAILDDKDVDKLITWLLDRRMGHVRD